MGDEGKQWKVYDRSEWWILERFTQSYITDESGSLDENLREIDET